MNESNDGLGHRQERVADRSRTRTRTGVLILSLAPIIATWIYAIYSITEIMTRSALLSDWGNAALISLAYVALVAGVVGACRLPLRGLARVVAAGLAAIIEPQLAYVGFYFVDFYLTRHLIALLG